jgi:hypothetical protein
MLWRQHLPNCNHSPAVCKGLQVEGTYHRHNVFSHPRLLLVPAKQARQRVFVTTVQCRGACASSLLQAGRRPLITTSAGQGTIGPTTIANT